MATKSRPGRSRARGTGRPSTGPPLPDLVLEVLQAVSAGSHANVAIRRSARSAPIEAEDRAALARTSYAILRWRDVLAAELPWSDDGSLTVAGWQIFGPHGRPGAEWSGRDGARARAVRDAVRGSALLAGLGDGAAPGRLDEETVLSSAPGWMAGLLSDSYGRGAAVGVLRDALAEPRELCLRVNTLKTSRGELIERLAKRRLACGEDGLEPCALWFPERAFSALSGEYRSGLVEIQDLPAQLVCRLVAHPGERVRVMDACAGAGGKSLAIAAHMANAGEIIAVDASHRSLARLRQRARRAGAFNIQRVHVARLPAGPGAAGQDGETDAAGGERSGGGGPRPQAGRDALRGYEGRMDRVLVDAPCSGLGTLRRNPDLRVHLDPERVAEFPAIQGALLDEYSRYVRPGGRLVYATCTLNPAENEGVVADFIRRHGGFSPIDARVLLPGLPAGVFRGDFFYPIATHGMAGFFGAAMERGPGGDGCPGGDRFPGGDRYSGGSPVTPGHP